MEKDKKAPAAFPLALSALLGWLLSVTFAAISTITMMFPDTLTDIVKIVAGFLAAAGSFLFLFKHFSNNKIE